MGKLGLLLVFVLCGCESVVDITVPGDYQSKIVVEGEFTPDSLWAVRIGRSVPLNEPSENNDSLSVIDATVVVSGEGGGDDTLKHIEQGLYRTTQNLRPLAGQRYNLQVAAPGLTSVEASSWAPPLESELVDVRRLAPQDTTGVEQVLVRLRLKDAPGKNYYEISLYQVVPVCADPRSSEPRIDDKSNNVTQYRWVEFESAAPFLRGAPETVDDPFFPPDGGVFSGGAYFSDQLFDDSLQEFVVNINSWVFETIEPLFMVTISILSTELLLYERTLSLHDLYLLGDPFLSLAPVEVYTNIQHGLGIFAGYTVDTYRFDAENELWEENEVGVGMGVLQPCDSLRFPFVSRASSFAKRS